MTNIGATRSRGRRDWAELRRPVLWGVLLGGMQAASPLLLWWLQPSSTHALWVAAIAAVYIGFAVADGRSKVIAAETCVASVFIVVAAAGVTGSAWLLVGGYAGHGLKDAWQERSQFVANTRWWPPFCATVDWLVASVIAVELFYGVSFH